MAVTMFDAGRGEMTNRDLIARAAYVVVSKIYSVMESAEQIRARRETRRQLARLSDAMLQDIGLERADVGRQISDLHTPGR